MTRSEYLGAVIRVFLSAPDTPSRARRSDWAVASSFHQRRIPLETVEHAVRLATIRRMLRANDHDRLEPIHSLAYFRQVIDSLPADALEPAYVDYVKHAFHSVTRAQPSAPQTKSAARKPECRRF
jgi:hypothetical protein